MPKVKRQSKPIIVNMTQRKPIKKKTKKAQQVTALGKILRAAGAAGGTALGGYFGAPLLGGSAGNQLGALASKWLGFGDYEVKQNSIMKSSMSVPAMHSTNQSVIVRHKEYVGPIVSSTGFTIQYSLPLNPGLAGTFPWLSGVAQRYQEYALKGAVFHYVPASGSAISGTSPSLGTVMLQTSYRASDSAPSDKTEMLNEYCASESVPSEAFIHPIECDPKENPFNIHYVRATNPPTGEPLMSYDLGKTFVATQGQLAAGNTLGDLWVTYEVELKKPVIKTDITAPVYYYGEFTPASNTNLFDALVLASGSLAVTANTSNTLTFPVNSPRTVVVNIDFRGSAFSAFAWNGSASLVNCVLKKLNARSETFICTDVASGAGQAFIGVVLEITDVNKIATFQISSLTYTGTVGTPEVSCFGVPSLLP